MKYTNLILAVMVVITGLFAASCAKDNSVVPASAGEQVTSADEVAMKQPAPGNYKIAKFIDTGDDETSQFNGYVFTFSANGGFTAKTPGGQVFNGSWSLNSAQTMMTLNIAGNNALDDLDDDDDNITPAPKKKYDDDDDDYDVPLDDMEIDDLDDFDDDDF